MLGGLLSLFAAGTCDSKAFLGWPTWYEYLPTAVDAATDRCEVIINFSDGSFSEIGLIALALVDIALRIAAIVAVGYVVYGGIQFVTAQGESDKTKKARQTVINALIGLAIALISTGIVTLIGAKIGKQ